jgi:hypothetical protein
MGSRGKKGVHKSHTHELLNLIMNYHKLMWEKERKFKREFN